MVQEQDRVKGLPVREFGSTILFSAAGGSAAAIGAEEILEEQMSRVQRTFAWIRDFVWVDPPRLVDAPPGLLGRVVQKGWYGRGTSEGYDELQRHFRCTKAHQPHRISMDYIKQIIDQYASQRDEDEDDD